jgi:hypothetical protein
MNEQAQAEQFTRQVDNFLAANNLIQAPGYANEDWPEIDRSELDVVQALATADFSAESQVRQTLKQKLLNAPIGEKERLMNTPIYQRSFVRLVVAGILIAFMIFALSPLGATMAQNLIETVRSWQLGENTTAVSVEGDFEAIQAEDGSTIIQPAPESPDIVEEAAPRLAGDNGRQVYLDPAISLEAAQERVDFTIRQPTFVPEGYEFHGVVFINADQVSLEYFNEPEMRLFGLLQTAVGSGKDGAQVTFTSDVITQDVLVNGHEALWTSSGDEGLLIWEADGVNYQLVGLGNLELALQIAESVQ